MRKVIHKKQAETSDLQLKLKDEKRLKVAILMNSTHYLLSRVFIFKEKGQFRLIVFSQGKLLVDATYKTGRGAKNAFSRFWASKKAIDNVKPKWTHFYTPEKDWLETWYHYVIKRKFISVLINKIFYYIETVFIMTVNNGYRLIVIHRGKLWTDKTYKTLDGAHMAFLSKYNHKAWKNGVKPSWSYFYPPDVKWLEKNLELIDKSF